jgi:hypothetical protein
MYLIKKRKSTRRASTCIRENAVGTFSASLIPSTCPAYAIFILRGYIISPPDNFPALNLLKGLPRVDLSRRRAIIVKILHEYLSIPKEVYHEGVNTFDSTAFYVHRRLCTCSREV